MSLDFNVELDIDQSDELITVVFDDGRVERMRLHDYDRVYAISGLYEEVVQRQLKCASPSTTAQALVDQMALVGEDPSYAGVLDIGAGNGILAEELRGRGVLGAFVGFDTEPAAMVAARRDRPTLYSDYIAGNLKDVPMESVVAEFRLTCLVGSGAIGNGHISIDSLAKLWNVFPCGSWLSVTVSEGHFGAIGHLVRCVTALQDREHCTQLVEFRRFRHRLRMSGEPIYYYVIVAHKQLQLPQ